jgi:hypothetical protein
VDDWMDGTSKFNSDITRRVSLPNMATSRVSMHMKKIMEKL